MTGITRFETEPDTWQPSDETPPTAFTTDDHTERDHTYFATDNGQLLTGVWECAPSILEIDSYPVHELMTVLAGSVTITDHDADSSVTFTTGDTFFVEKGTRLTWEITQTLRKYYVIVSDPATAEHTSGSMDSRASWPSSTTPIPTNVAGCTALQD